MTTTTTTQFILQQQWLLQLAFTVPVQTWFLWWVNKTIFLFDRKQGKILKKYLFLHWNLWNKPKKSTWLRCPARSHIAESVHRRKKKFKSFCHLSMTTPSLQYITENKYYLSAVFPAKCRQKSAMFTLSLWQWWCEYDK